VIDVNDHAPTVKVVFLGADYGDSGSSGRVSQHTRPGDTVARVSVTDADRHDTVTVRLLTRSARDLRRVPDGLTTYPGSSQNRSTSEPFQLTSHGDGVYVITVARSLSDVWYRLELVAVDSGALTSSAFLDIFVDDADPEALRFSRSI